MELDPKHKAKIIAILSVLFPDAKIYLFGSRARGTHRERSDIDIALDADRKLDFLDIGEVRDMLAESNIPYTIEIVDLHSVPEKMRNTILEEKIVWKP